MVPTLARCRGARLASHQIARTAPKGPDRPGHRRSAPDAQRGTDHCLGQTKSRHSPLASRRDGARPLFPRGRGVRQRPPAAILRRHAGSRSPRRPHAQPADRSRGRGPAKGRPERLRAADIALPADLSAGAFHVHFTDCDDVAIRVPRLFADDLYAGEPRMAWACPAPLRRRISAHLAVARANGDLLRALGQAILARPDMAAYVDRCRADRILQTTAASMAAEEIVRQSDQAQVLDVLMRGALDRLASPSSVERFGGALADGIARIWLATIANPAGFEPYRVNQAKDVASSGAARASQNAAASCAGV